jgi:hypothetical protein
LETLSTKGHSKLRFPFEIFLESTYENLDPQYEGCLVSRTSQRELFLLFLPRSRDRCPFCMANFLKSLIEQEELGFSALDRAG